MLGCNDTVDSVSLWAMSELLSTDELVSAVREATSRLAFNGRIDAQLSERTVRYYVTLRLVSPPVRHEGRSMWTRDHVNELIRIRRAQAQGVSLRDIDVRRPERIEVSAFQMANAPSLRLSEIDEMAAPVRTDGWAVRINDRITISGFGTRRPTQDELDDVRDALAGLTDM